MTTDDQQPDERPFHRDSRRENLVRQSVPADIRLDALDLRDLQVRFAELFDRAATELQAQGLEQDDAVFDRHLLCEAVGETYEVRADWLAHRERLLTQISSQLAERIPGVFALDRTRIVELRVTVRREGWPVRTMPPSGP